MAALSLGHFSSTRQQIMISCTNTTCRENSFCACGRNAKGNDSEPDSPADVLVDAVPIVELQPSSSLTSSLSGTTAPSIASVPTAAAVVALTPTQPLPQYLHLQLPSLSLEGARDAMVGTPSPASVTNYYGLAARHFQQGLRQSLRRASTSSSSSSSTSDNGVTAPQETKPREADVLVADQLSEPSSTASSYVSVSTDYLRVVAAKLAAPFETPISNAQAASTLAAPGGMPNSPHDYDEEAHATPSSSAYATELPPPGDTPSTRNSAAASSTNRRQQNDNADFHHSPRRGAVLVSGSETDWQQISWPAIVPPGSRYLTDAKQQVENLRRYSARMSNCDSSLSEDEESLTARQHQEASLHLEFGEFPFPASAEFGSSSKTGYSVGGNSVNEDKHDFGCRISRDESISLGETQHLQLKIDTSTGGRKTARAAIATLQGYLPERLGYVAQGMQHRRDNGDGRCISHDDSGSFGYRPSNTVIHEGYSIASPIDFPTEVPTTQQHAPPDGSRDDDDPNVEGSSRSTSTSSSRGWYREKLRQLTARADRDSERRWMCYLLVGLVAIVILSLLAFVLTVMRDLLADVVATRNEQTPPPVIIRPTQQPSTSYTSALDHDLNRHDRDDPKHNVRVGK